MPVGEQMSRQDRVRAFALAYHDLSRARPNLVFYLVSGTEFASTSILAANELLYRSLAEAGLNASMIVHAADLVVDYLNGFALGQHSDRARQAGEQQDLCAGLAKHPPEEFPTMHWVFSSVAPGDI